MSKKRTFRYPKFIDLDGIKAEVKDHKRYSLLIPIDKTKSNNIVVILRNPSKADNKISDSTVNRVISYVEENKNTYIKALDVGNIIILNLIPIYKKNLEQPSNNGIKLRDDDNLKIIKNILIENKTVIIAWGDAPEKSNTEHSVLANEVLDLLSDLHCNVFHIGEKNLSGSPRQALKWDRSDQMMKD